MALCPINVELIQCGHTGGGKILFLFKFAVVNFAMGNFTEHCVGADAFLGGGDAARDDFGDICALHSPFLH